MRKKAATEAQGPAPVNHLKLICIPFYQRKNESRDMPELKAWEHEWITDGDDFNARLRLAVDKATDEHHILIGFAHAHGHALAGFLQQADGLAGKNDVVLASPEVKNKRISEWMTGFRTAEFHTPFAIVNAETARNMLKTGMNLGDKYACLYALNKCGYNWAHVTATVQDAPKQLPGLKDKLRLTSGYYSPLKFASQPVRHLFWALALVALIAMTAMSRNAGISGDEFTQYDWADTAIIPYYTEGKQSALMDEKKLMHLYGSSFDTFTAIMARLTGTDDVYGLRHFWNAVVGFFCILFTSLIIKRLTRSYLWACVGLVLLFFTPRLLGDALNNPKDIPFAAGYVMGLYYALLFYGSNGGRFSQGLGLMLGIAAAISIRIGGLVLVPTVALYAGLSFIDRTGWSNFLKLKWKGFGKFIGTFLIIAFGGYLIGIAPWPYGIEEPLTNPLQALKAFTNFEASLRQLFEGKNMDSSMLPPYYLSKYLLITLPLISLAGVLLYLILGLFSKKNYTHAGMILFFAAAFPVFYIWLQKSNVYGGMRQILFVVPCLVASATLGFYLLQQRLKNIRAAAVAVPALALAGALPPAMHTVKNHPHEYIYFNEIVGGVKGAYSYYEMDYYLASLRQSSEWLLENVIRKNPDKKFEVLTYGMDHVKYYMRNDKNVHVGFTRPDERSNKDWDYVIFYNGFTDHARLTNGAYPPPGTVFTPMVDGKPVGWVVKRPSRADFEGYKLMEKDTNLRQGLIKFHEYLKADNQNSEVYFYMANAYANLGSMDSAIWAAKESLRIFPESSRSLLSLNTFYMRKQDWKNAIKTMDIYLESRPGDADGWWMKAQGQLAANELDGAKESINKAIGIEPIRNPSYYETAARIAQASKDQVNFRLYINAMGISSKDAKAQGAALEAIQSIYVEITGEELDLTKYQ